MEGLMKRLIISVLLCGIAVSVFPQEPLKTAVVEFEVKGNVSLKDAGTIAAEWMSSAASKTGRYELYERILLKKVLEEQKLGLSGFISEETAVKVGEIYGVKTIITGSVIEWQGIYSINARIINTESGQILASADYKTRDISALAGIMDKMAMVLAGTMSQEALDRESASITADKSIKVPYSIIKVFKKNGQLKAAINKGMNDHIKEHSAFTIFMPKYEESELTGQKTVVGIRRVGDLVITQVEPSISTGNLYISPGLADDPGLIEREGVAILSLFRMGAGVGVTNLGGHAAFVMQLPKWITTAEFGYTFPLLDFPSGIMVSGGFYYTVLGNNVSPFNVKIGGNYISTIFNISGDAMTSGMVLGITPQVDIGLFKFVYIRGGVFLGFNFIYDFQFTWTPIIQAGVNLFFTG
jgi:hypothetical protein